MRQVKTSPMLSGEPKYIHANRYTQKAIISPSKMHGSNKNETWSALRMTFNKCITIVHEKQMAAVQDERCVKLKQMQRATDQRHTYMSSVGDAPYWLIVNLLTWIFIIPDYSAMDSAYGCVYLSLGNENRDDLLFCRRLHQIDTTTHNRFVNIIMETRCSNPTVIGTHGKTSPLTPFHRAAKAENYCLKVSAKQSKQGTGRRL